ncbi:MAG: HAMP domain-containing histidine kinase, partial [Thaumarchaeota archaeon]
RNALRLKRLCNNLLDITRVESQTLRLEKVQFDLNELISSVIKDFRNQCDYGGNAGTQNVKVSFNPSDHVFVKADKYLIAQVILNLLDNAFKFTPAGTISISVRKKDKGKALVKIKDTGYGIDKKILPKLFSKFATISFTGTGIGLYISKCVIKAHGA